MTTAVRNFRISDAGWLPGIFKAAVSLTARHHYDQRQVDAWLALTPDEDTFTARYSDGRLAFVAVDEEDTPRGFADVARDGHIQFFYCHPDLSGSGTATALLIMLEMAAREDGILRLTVEASETACGFFERNGFSVILRREFEISGVPIHNYAMERRLD